ncbi:Putative uncharacterized protein [Moritella viscosa]|nr:Putative uncharacterized protein [Moritella viscosa]
MGEGGVDSIHHVRAELDRSMLISIYHTFIDVMDWSYLL